MKSLEFTTSIQAPVKKVWDTMLSPDTYRQWVNAGFPGSYYEGKWVKGGNMRFLSSQGGGTLVTITDLRPYEFVDAKHIAVLKGDGTEDRESDMAKTWTRTTESYTFTEKNGQTTLKTVMNIDPAWESMFTDGSWQKALAKLKEMCES